MGCLRPQGQQWIGLQPLVPVDDEERHALALRHDAATDDGRCVDEHLALFAVGRDEPVTLGRLVPGDRAEHAQRRIGGVVGRDPDAACLRAAVTLADLELDDLPLAQHAHPVVADDLGRVDVQVVGVLAQRDEAEAPVGIEPANGSLGHG